MMSSRGMAGCSAVAVLLVALTAAVEVYDDGTPGNFDTDLLYQEENDLDTGPVEEMDIPSLRNVMLLKMIRALEAHNAQDRIPYGPNWPTVDGLPANIKDPVFKRPSDIISTKKKNPAINRPQPKWKIKKGKAVGSHLVCYFKLCAFRSPS